MPNTYQFPLEEQTKYPGRISFTILKTTGYGVEVNDIQSDQSSNSVDLEAEASFAALATETKHLPPDVLFISKENFIQTASMLSLVSLTKSAALNTQENHFFKQSPQPAFNRQFDRLIVYLNDNHQKGYQNFICCASEQQAQRFKDIFEEGEETVHYKTLVNPLFEGFEDVA